MSYRTGGGRSSALCVYDGPASHAVAFGPSLKDAIVWERALLGDAAREVVSLAADGETYGHHHKFGDLALGALLDHLGNRPGVRVTNFGALLAERKPAQAAKLVAPSSWSCVHGVERWRADCGCHITDGTQ